jgi:hypothetical protein
MRRRENLSTARPRMAVPAKPGRMKIARRFNGGRAQAIDPVPAGDDRGGPIKIVMLKLTRRADVAQLVEQSIRNRQVIGSSPIVGSILPVAALHTATELPSFQSAFCS